MAEHPILDAKDVDRILKETTNSRLGFEQRWYIVDRFLEGIHFEKVVKIKEGETKLVEEVFPRGLEPAVIPRVEKQVDTILNILFMNNPVWIVYPQTPELQAIQNSDKLSTFFETIWDVLDIGNTVREATAYALRYNVGYLETGVDWNGNLFVERWSPWQIYHDVGIEDLNQTRFLIKVVKKTIEELKENPNYNQDYVSELKPEQIESISPWSDVRFKEKFFKAVDLGEDKNFVFVKEVWIRKGSKWYIGTECQGKWLREPQEAPYSLPFIAIKINPGEIYQTSLVEKLIPLNRDIDKLAAYLRNFVFTTAVGKILEPRAAKIQRIVNENGEIIRYEGGQEPKFMDVPPLSPAVIQFLNLLITWMDERGVAVLSFGKLPSAKLGWRALESLKQIELGNMEGIVRRIKTALKQLAQKILEVAETTWTDKIYEIATPTGTLKVLSADMIGTTAQFSNPDILPISSKFGVKVEIESGIAYTEEGKRETLLELLKAGVVSPEEVREKLKLGPSPVKESEEIMKQKAIQSQELERSLLIPPEQLLGQ